MSKLKTQRNWKPVGPGDVRLHFKCTTKGCRGQATVLPDFFQQAGCPLCPKCEEEMQLHQVKVDTNRVVCPSTVCKSLAAGLLQLFLHADTENKRIHSVLITNSQHRDYDFVTDFDDAVAEAKQANPDGWTDNNVYDILAQIKGWHLECVSAEPVVYS